MATYFDSSGQVYVETIAPAQSMVTSYLNNCTGREEDPKSYRNPGPGCRSLYATALRNCTWNVATNYPGMLETLPHYEWELMERIYQHLKHIDALNFKAWAVFKSALPGKVKGNYHVLVEQKTGGLGKIDSIRRQLNSLSFDTLTFLCFRSLKVTTVNLNTDIIKLTNLAVLILEQKGDKRSRRDDDKTMKNWGLSVAKTNAFTKLRVLSLKNFDISVSEALKGLTVFPALVLCNLDSFNVKLDLKPFLKEGKVYTHPNGRWRQKITNSQGSSSWGSNPETVLSRTDITTHTKMEQLYEIAAMYLKALSMDVARDPIISVHYGQVKSVRTTCSSAWFIRIFPSKKEPEPATAKRQVELENEPKSIVDKKRKVRNGKERDIGSMLGSFGV